MDDKQELRKYIEEKIVRSLGLRAANALATIAGITGGGLLTSKAIKKGEKIYKKRKKAKQTKTLEAITPRHAKWFGRILGKSALVAAAWTGGERVLSTALKKSKKAAEKKAKVQPNKKPLR